MIPGEKPASLAVDEGASHARLSPPSSALRRPRRRSRARGSDGRPSRPRGRPVRARPRESCGGRGPCAGPVDRRTPRNLPSGKHRRRPADHEALGEDAEGQEIAARGLLVSRRRAQAPGKARFESVPRVREETRLQRRNDHGRPEARLGFHRWQRGHLASGRGVQEGRGALPGAGRASPEEGGRRCGQAARLARPVRTRHRQRARPARPVEFDPRSFSGGRRRLPVRPRRGVQGGHGRAGAANRRGAFRSHEREGPAHRVVRGRRPGGARERRADLGEAGHYRYSAAGSAGRRDRVFSASSQVEAQFDRQLEDGIDEQDLPLFRRACVRALQDLVLVHRRQDGRRRLLP